MSGGRQLPPFFLAAGRRRNLLFSFSADFALVNPGDRIKIVAKLAQQVPHPWPS
jgi:hypothetical protein